MSDFTIRTVRADDYEQWLSLWLAYNAFYGRSGATALADAVTETTWRRFLAPDETMYAHVAVTAGQVIGLVHYLFHRSTSAIQDSCYLQDLFTAENQRGQGVARALIESVYAAAQTAGTSRVYWHTHENNRIAQRLYDRIAQRSGFIVYRKVL